MADRFSGTAPSPEATAAGDSAAESDRTICVDGKLADPDTPVSSPTTTEPGYGLPGFGYDAPPAMPLAGRPSYTG
jgi:hypothetical protein